MVNKARHFNNLKNKPHAPHKTQLYTYNESLQNLTSKPHPVILLPLGPVSLMHKNPQRRKIIHGMCLIGCKDRSIDLNMSTCRNIRPVCVTSVAVIMAVV